MKSHRGDLLDVVEVDGVAVASADGGRGGVATALGDTVVGRRLLWVTGFVARQCDRSAWWRRADAARRRWSAATLALVLLAAMTAGLAAGTHPETRAVTRHVVIPAEPSGVDAIGCPVTRRCGVRTPPRMRVAVGRALPGLTTTAATETYDLDSGRVYRRELLAQAVNPQSALRLVAQCVEHGRPIADDVTNLFGPVDGGLSGIVGRRVTLGFAPGCSSFGYYTEVVALDTTTPGTVPIPREPYTDPDLARRLSRVSALVADPDVRVFQ